MRFIIFLFGMIISTYGSVFYIGSMKSEGIYYSSLNLQNGVLSEFQNAAKLTRPSFLSIDKNNKRLYSTNLINWKTPGEIVSFLIHDDFSLIKLNQMSSRGGNPCHLTLSPNKNILFAANYNNQGSVISYRLDTDGSIKNIASHKIHYGSGNHPQRQKEAHAHSIYPHPKFPFVYSADLGADSIFIYKFDQLSGELELIKKESLRGNILGPRHMKWDKKGRFLYVLNELDLSLSIFEYLNDGYIREVNKINALFNNSSIENLTAAEVRFHPTLPILYTSIRDKDDLNRDKISVFKVEGSKTKLIDVVPAIVNFPRNFNLDPTGKWMLVAGQRSKNIAVFSINPKGIPIYTKRIYEFPGEPVCIEFLN